MQKEGIFLKIKILSLFLALAVVLSFLPAFTLSVYGASYTDEQWEDLILRYRQAFYGTEDVDWTDPQIRAIVGEKDHHGVTVSGTAYQGGKYWNDLEKNRQHPGRIFGKRDITIDTPSSDMGLQFLYLQYLAEAYATPGSEYTYRDRDGVLCSQNLYRESDLRAAIFYGLEKSQIFYSQDFWSRQAVSPSNTLNYNWWDWAYQAPNQIGRILMAVYPFETEGEERIATAIAETAIAFVDLIRPNTHSNYNTQMEYRRTRMSIIPVLAAIVRDDGLMDETRSNLAYFLRNDYTYADGVKQDGSYICHGSFAMEGRYGIDVLISRVIDTYSILHGTVFAPVTSNRINQFYWIMDVFKPLMLDSGIMAQSNGREPQSALSMGPIVIKGALELLGCFGAQEDLQLKQFIRQIVVKDTAEETRNAYAFYARSMGSVNLVNVLKSVVFDQSVATDTELYGVMRYKSDRAVQHREKYTVGLAMSSNRIANYESINGRNRYGWFTGDGMIYVYNDETAYDYDPYGEAFQRFANMHRIPGTTQEAEPIRLPWSNRMHYFPGMTYVYDQATKISTWKKDMNVRGQYVASFVGGVEFEGQFIAAAMDFEAYSWSPEESEQEIAYIHTTDSKDENAENNQTKQVVLSDLTAKKSYFLFDDEIVCVGTDIDFTTREGAVYTYVDNRELLETDLHKGIPLYGTEDIIVDGRLLEKTNSFPQPKIYEDPKWIHQENFGGYYFPQGGTVGVNKTFRATSNDGDKGNDDYNRYYLDITPKTEQHSFMELWLDHGSKPQNGTYAYVMLPEHTAEETADYSRQPDVTILCSSDSVHVIREHTLGITAMVFWQAGSYEDITVSQPCILMIREQDGQYTVAVSDPTQSVSTAYVTIRRKLYPSTVDPRITVSGEDKTYLDLNFAGIGGKTLSGTFYISEPRHLMFDFRPENKERYSSTLYGYSDYTSASCWDAGESAVSVYKGALTFAFPNVETAEEVILCPTGAEDGTNTLQYDPGGAEIFQIRLKLSDAVPYGDGIPHILLQCSGQENGYSICHKEEIRAEISAAVLDGGELEDKYITLTCHIKGETFAACDRIRGIRLLFRGIKAGSATIDYIYLGPNTDQLFFDFKNDAEAHRYDVSAYGGYAYDNETGAPWATACTDSLRGYYTVDNERGTLSVYTGTDCFGTPGVDAHYGPYLETTASSGIYPWSDAEYHALSYIPRGEDVIEIRFRGEALQPAPGEIPQLYLLYTTENQGVTARHSQPLKEFLLSEEYQTIRMPLPAEFRTAEYIKSLGFRFKGVRAADTVSVGKIEIDYIYVGSETKAPSRGICFDFGHGAEERVTYDSEDRWEIEFSRIGWIGTGAKSEPVVNYDRGTLSFAVTHREKGPVGICTEDQVQGMLPLNFIPRDAEYIQLRFRLENFVPYDTACLALYYDTAEMYRSNGRNVSQRIGIRILTAEELNSREFLTVTFAVPSGMRSEERITAFRIELKGCSGESRKNPGILTLDYLYVGPEKQLPIPFRRIFWHNGEGETIWQWDVVEGESLTYPGQPPAKASDAMCHYRFLAWTDSMGRAVDVGTVRGDVHLYPVYEGKPHVFTNGTCICGQKAK